MRILGILCLFAITTIAGCASHPPVPEYDALYAYERIRTQLAAGLTYEEFSRMNHEAAWFLDRVERHSPSGYDFLWAMNNCHDNYAEGETYWTLYVHANDKDSIYEVERTDAKEFEYLLRRDDHFQDASRQLNKAYRSLCFPAVVVNVLPDGRLEVEKDLRRFTVKLAGLPDPAEESRGAFRQHLEATALSRSVTVWIRRIQLDGVIVGDLVLYDGRNLNQEMISAGYGWNRPM